MFEGPGNLAVPSNIGTCRWNAGMTRFPDDPAQAPGDRPRRESSATHYSGGFVSDILVATQGSGATAAVAGIRERNRRRQNASGPCDHRRL